MADVLFPRTVAQGDAFCDREQERKRLKDNIYNIQHSLVISPRRYGKTSLILKTINEIKWPYVHVDLFLALEEKKIMERFLNGIAKLVSEVIPINLKAVTKIRDFFKSFSVSLTAGDVSFELKLESGHNHPTTLRAAIESLENLLLKHKKRAIFFIDEMQDIAKTGVSDDIEAILRFYAQKTKSLAFIFSGSNRKLLQEIFNDRTRPLFKMCDRLNLQRIAYEDYSNFLNDAARTKWSKELLQSNLDEILKLTERHPYYVNYLCGNLWHLNKLPTVEQIRSVWMQMCNEEASGIAMDIEALSLNQKKLLDYIAQKGALINSTAQEHQQRLRLTSRGILQSLKGLLEKDIVEKTNEGIKIIDPLLKSVLLR